MAPHGGLSFAGLLDRTFSAISRTWTTSLALGAVLLIPSSILFGFAYGKFLDVLKDLGSLTPSAGAASLVPFGLAYLWIVLAVLAHGVVFLFVRACVTEHTARSLRGESPRTLEIAAHVISRLYGPLLGQRLLQAAIIVLTVGGVSLVVGVVIGILAAVKAALLAAVLGGLLMIAGMCVVMWISIRYSVTLEAMVVDGSGIERSLDRSMELVKGRWWRVFGYTLLFGLMVSFASSLVATPIMFFSTLRQFIHNLQAVLQQAPDPRQLNRTLLLLFSGMGRRLGILQYVQGLASAFVTPVFMTLLFLDLKEPRQPPTGAVEPAAGGEPRP